MIFDNDCRILHGGMKSEWALRQIRRTGAAEHHSGTLSRSTVAHSCRFAMLCRHCRAFGAPSADNGTQWHTAARRNRGERIERNAKRAGRSITDYLVLLSLETPIHVAEDVKPLLIELKRIGNNLNQITAKINAGAFRSYNFEDMIDGQKKIYEQLLEIARKG